MTWYRSWSRFKAKSIAHSLSMIYSFHADGTAKPTGAHIHAKLSLSALPVAEDEHMLFTNKQSSPLQGFVLKRRERNRNHAVENAFEQN